MTADESLPLFFAPKSVALVGASLQPEKLGYRLAHNLAQRGYPGEVYFVNPKGGELFGRNVYPDVASLPAGIELAVVLVPAQHVPQVLEECGESGVRAAIVCSGGFREVGEEGVEREKGLLRIAKKHNMRLLGPNCIGVLDTHLPLDTTFLPLPGPLAGDLAFLSHSGAICAALVDWARQEGFGFSRLVSLGNQLDVNETDILPLVAEDPATKVISMYLETVSDGRCFVETASKVSQRKPLIALKVGRFESGRRAAASHTGALAGEQVAYQAAFRRAGVEQASTIEEMFDWARALAQCPIPRGSEVAVLTNAGGPGVTAADAVEYHGLQLAALHESTQSKLRALLPPVASVENPVDMLATASPEQYRDGLAALLADDGVHGVIVILPPPPAYAALQVVEAMLPGIEASDKPVVVALMGGDLVSEARHKLRQAGVPDYRFPEAAASALAVLARRTEYLARSGEEPLRATDVDAEAVERVLAANAPGATGFLSQDAAEQILRAYGIPVAATRLARDLPEARSHAAELGYPLALKLASPELSHKSDVGGVLLDLPDAPALEKGYEQLMANAHRFAPDAEVLGVYLQPMIAGGQEVIVGVSQDAQFGPLVMFGSGGVEVEGFGDVAFALAPLTESDVDYLLESTWAGRRLAGFRNLPPADRDAVCQVLLRIAQLAADFPKFTELELNPLRVLSEGDGAWAVDWRLRLSP